MRETPEGWRLLMLRAFNHWDFPKGLIEPGESPHAAALREVAEETGLDDLRFPWGESHLDSGPYNRGKVARYYLALTHCADVRLLPNPQTGRAEHSEFRWLNIARARQLASPRVVRVIDWAEHHLHG